jgi:hypothetical protein
MRSKLRKQAARSQRQPLGIVSAAITTAVLSNSFSAKFIFCRYSTICVHSYKNVCLGIGVDTDDRQIARWIAVLATFMLLLSDAHLLPNMLSISHGSSYKYTSNNLEGKNPCFLCQTLRTCITSTIQSPSAGCVKEKRQNMHFLSDTQKDCHFRGYLKHLTLKAQVSLLHRRGLSNQNHLKRKSLSKAELL